MLFNTKEFAIFFAIILIAYWVLYKWRALQNFILFTGSLYFYYSFYNNVPFYKTFPVYLLSIIITGYVFGIIINKAQTFFRRKLFLISGICLLGLGLSYIKYSGLILGNIHGLEQWQAKALGILVPIGISYYTFASIGYITDVYRRRLEPEYNFITYSAYISFFPHLLIGPIPSATTILPQFKKRSAVTFLQVEQSVGEIIWGLFKKMVVADNILLYVNYCFSDYQDMNGSTLFIGVTLFSFYLYSDFSGYSDIARGLARLMGIELVQNFQLPFFSRNPGEYWRRWHTSLRKWMLDYLYIPMGGNKGSRVHYIVMMLFIFGFSGMWHGANITFLCWGLLNGLYFIPYILTNNLVNYKEPVALGKIIPGFKDLMKILLTFNLVNLAWVFFRAPDIIVAKEYYQKIFSSSFFESPLPYVFKAMRWFLPVLIVEWLQRERPYVLDFTRFPLIIRVLLFAVVIISIYLFYKKQNMAEYYYFKF